MTAHPHDTEGPGRHDELIVATTGALLRVGTAVAPAAGSRP
ncbi:hypothetical protein [Isoptericola croceus]|nr:hypothetical protein [Isoptericola croceus]